MPSNEDYDWIFDFVMQFLESDRFDSAVMDFVDEKCFVFEDVEENRFIYTDIHREFRDHIEALISSNLGELGITTELFFESCENGRNNRDINKQVFERMIAMEDFETFKKLMTKRNMELQLETIRLYNTARSSRTEKRLFIKEEQEVADALEASLRSDESERIKLLVPEELKALLDSETRHPDDRLGSIGDSEVFYLSLSTSIVR
jgi:The ARF-like 2 binding protein BART